MCPIETPRKGRFSLFRPKFFFRSFFCSFCLYVLCVDAGRPRPRVYTPEGTYTSQRTGGSPSPNSDFLVLKQ